MAVVRFANAAIPDRSPRCSAMTMSDKAEFARLEAAIFGAESQIQQQREFIANLRSSGAPLDDAERTLEVMIGILERLQRYRAVIRHLSKPAIH